MRRAAAFAMVLAGLLFALLSPQAALGHAALRSSDPSPNAFLQRAPGQVTLSFTEPIDSKSSSIQILDAAGQPIATDAVSVSGSNMTVPLPALKAGIYNVLWANVSRIDGHAIRGSFPFTVLNPDGSLPDQTNTVSGTSGEADPAPLADGVAVRALSLLGLAMVVAGAVITLLWRTAEPRVAKGMVWCVYAGAAVLLAATALNFVTIRDAYTGIPAGELIFKTPSGGYWLTRLGLVMLIGVANTFAFEAPRRTAAALLGSVVLYLWAFTATSHAAAGAGSAWAKSLDIAHSVAALAWIGAVVGIAVAARLGRRESDWKALVPRFSLLASAMVFILLATGTLSAFVEIEKVSKLWETKYGVALLVKLGLILPLLAVAGYNARWGRHRLAQGAPGEPRRFLLFATGEVALGLAVFLAAAFLTQTTVAKSVAIQPDAKPFDQTSPFGELLIRLTIDPNQTGLNTYRVELKDAAGADVPADRVRLTFRYQEDPTVGASSLTLSKQGDAYLGQGPFMTLEGRWRVETEVRRPGADDLVGFFDVRPAGAAVVTGGETGAWDNPAPGLSWNEFAGFVFLLAGLGFALSRGAVRQLGREAGWAANGMTMAGFSLGVLLLFGVHGHEDATGLRSNPIAADRNSIAEGQRLFQDNCITCHGRSGVPPAGLDLNPYPLDLTVHVPQHPDGQIFKFIDEGVPGSAMRAWGEGDGALSEEQIWHIVNFLRTLTPVDR
jgi:copper transport protein